ncbi:aspartate aminotransferase family protein [Streptosporangium sp. NPDC004631]
MNAAPVPAGLSPEDAALMRRRREALGGAYRLFYRRPVQVSRGEGVWLYDRDGEPYLDAYNNVACVGHANPRVVAAMAGQAAVLNTHTRYLGDEVVDYAERLLELCPPELSRVMFTCTGSEANDLACRVAMQATGGRGFIVTDNAYHGLTALLAGLSPSLGLPPDPAVRRIAPPEQDGADPREAAAAFAGRVHSAAAELAAQGIPVAGLMVDTIMSSDGILPGPPGALAAAADAVRAHGGLFIADEVQAGFARVGTPFWGFARHGLVPDIVTMGKPMGNGYPIGGVVMRAEPADGFGAASRYFNTFGGNAVAAATGMAVLDELLDRRLPASADEVGGHLAAGLRSIVEPGGLGSVRGAGLFLGVELADRPGLPAPRAAAAIVEGLRERRTLIGTSGPDGRTLKIRPPLVFEREHADLLLERLAETVAALDA